ncbi:DnaJ family domain-containing protein [Nocardioides pacificus]
MEGHPDERDDRPADEATGPHEHARPSSTERARDQRTGGDAAAARIQHQSRWVELQIQQAMERGDFDDLPGYGKPIKGLGAQHDPDWWLKRLVEREQISVLPPALQIRKDDAELDARLDRITTAAEVRREVEDFNARVRSARIQPLGGPPMITKEREVEAEVDAWATRREARRTAQREALARAEQETRDERAARRRRPTWRRRTD